MVKRTSFAFACVVLATVIAGFNSGCKNSASTQTTAFAPTAALAIGQSAQAAQVQGQSQPPAAVPPVTASPRAGGSLPQDDKKPVVPPQVRTGPNEPSRGTLCVGERQVIRVDGDNPSAIPFVGKRFNVCMAPPTGDPADLRELLPERDGIHGVTAGTFDVHIKDNLPRDFKLPDPGPTVTACVLRKLGQPMQADWGNRIAPEFGLNVPRFAYSPTRSDSTEGAWFEYEGRASVEAPPCFTSELTVSPAQIPAGKISDVTLTLTLDTVKPNTWPGGMMIMIQGQLPTQVGESTIAYERPDPVYIKTFLQTERCTTRPYMINGGAASEALPPNYVPNMGRMKPRPDQDPRMGGVPATIEFKLHVTAPKPGPLRLERVLWCTQSINGVVLPVATASSPQAKDVQYRASASVERFHNVTIMVK